MASVRGATRIVHLDVCDGILYPSKTWPFGEAGQRSEISQLGKENDISFEVHLMVADFREAFTWLVPSVTRIVLDARSEKLFETMQTLLTKHNSTSATSIALGVALTPNANISVLAPIHGLYDFVQVMGIDKVGFQGQTFDSRALELLRHLRSNFPDMILQVDGGVGAKHLREVALSGANRIIEGSGIFDSSDPKFAFANLCSIANTL